MIYVIHIDRLSRFGVQYIIRYCDVFNTEVVVANKVENKEPHSVLMDDFMALVTSFAGHFYGLRSAAFKKELVNKAGDVIG